MRPQDVGGSLRAFTAERAPAGVVGALALALCAGPWALTRGDGFAFLRAAAVAFLVLLALRAADDLRSIDSDRLAHPDRGLPSGRVAARPLAAGAALLSGAALLLGAPRLTAGLAALAAYYAAMFAVAHRVPPVLRPPLVNVVFLAIPPGVAALVRRAGGPAVGAAEAAAPVALALCFWLSAVGHDFAHEVHARDETPPGPLTISALLGPRAAAALGLACWAGGCLAGLGVARAAHAAGGWPTLFLASLVAFNAWVGILLARLVARPCRERARRLYVSGVLGFGVPSLMLGLDRVLGW